MKAHTLLCVVAFAAGTAISMAQSNVVTNVSVLLLGNANFNFICNPLLNNPNNDITNLFRSTSDEDQIYRWNPVEQNLDGAVSDGGFSHTWSPHFILQPGETIFYLNASPNRTQTFVGQPIQGPYTNPIPFRTTAVLSNGLFNAYGSILPVPASVTNALAGLPPADGDQISFFNIYTQDLDSTVST